jgi:tRNA(Ile)-lysidine synthase
MANSRKRRSDKPLQRALDGALGALELRKKSVVVGLSGGVDSVVLLHLLKARAAKHGFDLRALHVHHGLSRNADRWARHCRAVCRAWGVPLQVFRVSVTNTGKGREAAARDARYAAFRKAKGEVLMLAHQLDDQAETVLLNLLRGAGVRGASGMPASAHIGEKLLVRPLLGVPREAVMAHAVAHRLKWVEDESNLDESLTRNFLRRSVGPLLAARFPRWREALARAARHFARRDLEAADLLRAFLRAKGLRGPSEARLSEMLKQLASGASHMELTHDGARLKSYRGEVFVLNDDAPVVAPASFTPVRWSGEKRVLLPALGGELRFRRVRGRGFALPPQRSAEIRLRSGGERLKLHEGRPRRTLKNLFQEAGMPPWKRERLPLVFCGDALVCVPGLGIDARYQAARGSPGWLAEWHQISS